MEGWLVKLKIHRETELIAIWKGNHEGRGTGLDLGGERMLQVKNQHSGCLGKRCYLVSHGGVMTTWFSGL